MCCSMLTLSTQLCTECITFNCIHVDTVDTCIFTCSFYTDSLKKSRTGNSTDTITKPLLHQRFQTYNMRVGSMWSAQWSGRRVLLRLSMKHVKITWWAWWKMPICWRFMQSESLCSPRTSSLPVEYGERRPGWTWDTKILWGIKWNCFVRNCLLYCVFKWGGRM